MTYKVVIIGGGAAGIFSAINLASRLSGKEILVLEKSNKLLTKVKVSGGGRCNVTHACFDPKELARFYPRGQKELMGPFHHFYTADTISWFAERGVELKVEEDGRMFPTSDSSQTIINCFLSEIKKNGITIWQDAEVVRISKSTNFEITLKSGQKIRAENIVVATGGHNKVKHYQFIEALGHQIVSPIPSLFTFNLKSHESNKLMGVSQEAKVKLVGTQWEEFGPVLFTHWGMSGPAILKLSAKGAKYLHKQNYQFNIEVSWLENAEEFILENRKQASSYKIGQKKPEAFSKRFWEYLIKRANISNNLNWADLNKTDIKRLIKVLENDLYQANGKTTFKEEFVTCGGVELKEIEMKTMESKIVKGLYFCGEVVNIDALTGGFNFQAAWTTAWLAANNIVINNNIS